MSSGEKGCADDAIALNRFGEVTILLNFVVTTWRQSAFLVYRREIRSEIGDSNVRNGFLLPILVSPTLETEISFGFFRF